MGLKRKKSSNFNSLLVLFYTPCRVSGVCGTVPSLPRFPISCFLLSCAAAPLLHSPSPFIRPSPPPHPRLRPSVALAVSGGPHCTFASLSRRPEQPPSRTPAPHRSHSALLPSCLDRTCCLDCTGHLHLPASPPSRTSPSQWSSLPHAMALIVYDTQIILTDHLRVPASPPSRTTPSAWSSPASRPCPHSTCYP